MDVVNGLSLSA